MPLIDVVNFNADASCLSSAKWMRVLEGGSKSQLVSLFSAYVDNRRKVNLGLVGVTICDIARYNPEAIEVINAHPDVFEIVVRPFAHDNALLRLPAGFRYNAELGLRTIRKFFRNVNSFYLAPELMVTGEQIRILHEMEISAIFLHKGRYGVDVTRHVPDTPFEIYGVLGTPMICVPFCMKDLESQYLRALHGTLESEQWVGSVTARLADGPAVLWRDGESSLLHPQAPALEARLLAAESSAGVPRAFLSELDRPSIARPAQTLRYFPLHSMKPWMETMKLYWYVDRVRQAEQSLSSLDEATKRVWSLTINSDVLSAAEKSAPVIDVSSAVIGADPSDPLWEGLIALPEQRQLILSRSERAGEGEDYLAYLDLMMSGEADIPDIFQRWSSSSEPHLRKAVARVADLAESLAVPST
jgi:hypothetical protein